MPLRKESWITWTGRILAAVWAGFWTWFGLASGIAEGLSPAGILMHTLLPGLVFSVLVVVVWRWPAAGGVVLIAVAALVAWGYPNTMFRHRPVRWDWYFFILLTMALPPLASGLLLLAGRRKAAGALP